MVTITYDHGARRRSYELIADAFGVEPPARAPRCMRAEDYRAAFTDWARLRLARVLRARGPRRLRRRRPDRRARDGGHVLDFDDTYLPGIAHLSAPVAPAALALGAHEGATVGDVLAAYADGFEAMGALAAAGHPALYDRGWHPTAVCGAVGAAVAAARLLGADRRDRRRPRRPARRRAARRVRLGREVDPGRARGRDRRGRGAAGRGGRDGAAPTAIAAAWRDAYGGELGHHAARRDRAATGSRPGPAACRPTGRSSARSGSAASPDGPLTVLAHPVSRQAAGYDAVETPLQAKFSIPYTTAFTLLHGGPRVDDFAALDPEAQPSPSASRPHRRRARRVGVRAARRRRGARARRRRPRLAAAPALPRATSAPRSTTSPATASTISPTTSRPPSCSPGSSASASASAPARCASSRRPPSSPSSASPSPCAAA